MSENDKKINEQLDKALWENKPVSTTDCTGLLQGLPVDDETADTSAKMYNIAPNSNDNSVPSSKKVNARDNIEP